jgi:hypothetical protein
MASGIAAGENQAMPLYFAIERAFYGRGAFAF